MLRRILVAFDGSDKSYEAFNFALDLVKNCSWSTQKIRVISVAQLPEPMDYVEMNPGAIIDNITQYYEGLFNGLKEKAKKKGVEIVTEVVVGHPAEQIAQYAKEQECDMIVMGHRGRSKIAGWLLGSVSRSVASHSHCTITIVK